MLAPGTSIHSKRQVRWLLDAGCEVIFVDRHNPFPEGQERFRFVPYPRAGCHRLYEQLGPPGRFVASWSVARQLRRMARKLRPHLFHLQWFDDRVFDCIRAELRPLVLSVWGTDVNTGLGPEADPHRRRLAGQALARVDRLIADAASLIKACERLAGCEVPSEMLTLGIDTDLFRAGYQLEAAEWRAKLDVSTSSKVLLSARAWDTRYGHGMILEAFARALPRFSSGAILVFKIFNRSTCVDPVAYESQIRHRASELGVASSLRWITEEVSYGQMPAIYALADIVVNYPVVDGFPVSFLEAAACERRIVSCRLPAYAGTFAEEYFRLVKPRCVSELADAFVEEVETSPNAALLADARRAVEAEHDERVSARRLLDVYEQVLGLPVS